MRSKSLKKVSLSVRLQDTGSLPDPIDTNKLYLDISFQVTSDMGTMGHSLLLTVDATLALGDIDQAIRQAVVDWVALNARIQINTKDIYIPFGVV